MIEACPRSDCAAKLHYPRERFGGEVVCAEGHRFARYAHGALQEKDGHQYVGHVYVERDEYTGLIDFQAVFHNTVNRLDSPVRFFGGIRELVERLAERARQEGDENGNPMARAAEKLRDRGYARGYGGC